MHSLNILFNWRVFTLVIFLLPACAHLPLTENKELEPLTNFEISHSGMNIAGEIHRIEGTDPKIAAIVVGGSGVGSRADTAAALPLFLSDDTAVVIYDRRGFGNSGGKTERPNTRNSLWQVPLLAGDAAKIAAHLKVLGFTRVGLVGSSMGAWIAVAAPTDNDVIDFRIAISGGASSVATSDAFDSLTDQSKTIDDAMAEINGIDLVDSYDPNRDLRENVKPTLWVLGELDESNPTALDVENVEIFRDLGHPYDVIIVPNADHNFLDPITREPQLNWLSRVKSFIENG